MNYEEIRRFVEEEVLRSLSSARSGVRIRRSVLSESQVVAAWRRGSRTLAVAAGGIITPAARERAAHLGVSLQETVVPPRRPKDVEAVVEAVLAQVIASLDGRPRAERPAPTGAVSVRRLVTAADVEQARFRDNVLRVGKRARVTPLAWDVAEKYGVRIVRE